MAASLGHRWVLVFAKEPAPGKVKTRLGRVLGMPVAASLAKALLEDTLRLARRGADELGATLLVAHSPDRPSAGFLALLTKWGAQALPQGEGDLGSRLARGLSATTGSRVVLGMDSPDLPSGRLAEAFETLETERAVLGPCPDGGYYLLGLSGEVDAVCLASGIRWSSEHTLADTEVALGGCKRLPDHADIDEMDDLCALAERLRDDPARAPATWAWLEAHPHAVD